MIKKFTIKKLFGEKNVEIIFDSSHKIIVAENGYGKTTILNCFYAVLSGDFDKLNKIQFESISVTFSNNKSVVYNKNELSNGYESLIHNDYYSMLSDRIGEDELKVIANNIYDASLSRFESTHYISELSDTYQIPTGILKDVFYSIRRDISRTKKSKTSGLKSKINIIKDNFPFDIIYLPTYRRIEDNIANPNRLRSDLTNGKMRRQRTASIKFGMMDVQDTINELTNEIKNSSIESFSRVNGEMLTQLVNGFKVTDEMLDSISSAKEVEIVLNRIGNNLPSKQKEEILHLISSGKINTNHEPLIYFVSNLMNVYKEQRVNDKLIQDFVHVCNKYLRDKEFIYDEGNVTVNIMRKGNNGSSKTVSLESLSSGEKQIISIFSNLYLRKEGLMAIFFDEPELSLSIEWQKKLLPDIIESQKCMFLFCTTHSPFIFDNDLMKNTSDLSEYIKDV